MSDDRAREMLLARELGVLVQDPPPPSGVDVAEAARVGRRRLRRRRAATGGVALALATAVTAGALALPAKNPGPGPSPGPATGETHHVVDPHDPATTVATFGWLPPGTWSQTIDTPLLPPSAKGQATGPVTSADEGGNPASIHPKLILIVHPRGNAPWPPAASGFSQWTNTPKAPDVNGHPAYWLETSNLGKSSPAGLGWQVSDGRWLEMQVKSMPAAGLPEALLRTAAAVRFERYSVPMPFSLKPPPGMRVDDASATLTQQGGRPVPADESIEFALIEANGHSLNYHLTVSAHQAVPPPDISGWFTGPNAFSRTCKTAQGLDACLFVTDHLTPSNTPSNLAALGGLRGLLDSVTLLGPDPKNWTTNVLR
ncbi:hypothetical protein ABIA32_000255 [Streptacidiphilus sp. MAP12-20]|uniref:hypothetical protein n=1 Tax=Streptacidiphilus sp. MAP12-20 TaxID=3156299 RepID=UPI003516D6CC